MKNSPRHLSALRPGFRSALCLMSAFVGTALLGMAQSDPSAEDLRNVFLDRTVQLEVQPGKQSYDVEWSFMNLFGVPMKIERIESSSDSLKGKTGHPQFEDLDVGAIKATFTPGELRGLVRNSIRVYFVGCENPVRLLLEARIPTAVEVSTSELTWLNERLSKADRTRSIDVTSGTGEPFAITGLSGLSEDSYAVSQETVVENRHYRLHITPADKLTTGTATLQVRTNAEDPRDQLLSVSLRTIDLNLAKREAAAVTLAKLAGR